MQNLITTVGAIAALSVSANAQVFTGGPSTIDPDGDSVDYNFDISGLTGEFTGFILEVDFGGDRFNDNEFDLDLRTTLRTDPLFPFSQFLDDNNFTFVYDSNNILTVEDDFLNSPLIGGQYNNLRLRLFNDLSNDEIDVESVTLTLVPAPGAASLIGLAGLVAARRRR